MSQKRYTIRQIGQSSWGDADTAVEALRVKAEAKDRLGPNAWVIIYDNEQQRDVTSEIRDQIGQ
jgi:hypothetical protein